MPPSRFPPSPTFSDSSAPPATVLSAAVASSTGTAVLYMPMYARPFFNTMTELLIEAPVIEKAKVTQS
jgi:hypothetical protein